MVDIASGSGGPALFVARTVKCQVTGFDLNEAGVREGNRAAEAQGLADRVRFRSADAREPLPLPDASAHAVICIDAINHLYERKAVFRECHRVLRPGGRWLFTDPITVTGLLRREEMILRGPGIGEVVFTSPEWTSGCSERPGSTSSASRT